MLAIDVLMKPCTKCGEIKPATLEFFHLATRHDTRLRAVCRQCWPTCKGRTGHRALFGNRGETRICSKCFTEKPATIEYFHKGPNMGDGLRSMCKECYRAWKIANHDTVEAKKREWERNHPEQDKGAKRKHYLENRDTYIARSASWQQLNPKKVKIRNKRWSQRNPEKVLAIWERRIRNLQLARDVSNPLSPEEWKELLISTDYLCAYCFEMPLIITADHVLPISREGKDTKENVVPACLPCNSSKNDRTPEEWFGIGR